MSQVEAPNSLRAWEFGGYVHYSGWPKVADAVIEALGRDAQMKTRLLLPIGLANWRRGNPGNTDRTAASGSARQRVRDGFERSVGRVLAVALLGLMVMGVRAAAAATLVVDNDGMASATDCNATTPAYMTISAAVAAANPDDTIKVCPGLYPELVQVNKMPAIP